jgi:2-methylaconitate cis-trans-isomerase PrpF
VTCLDAGNPCVFVPASALVSDATLLPEAMERDDQLCKRLEEIRQAAAVKMGLATGGRIPDAIPKICLVAPAQESLTLSGEVMRAAAIDILARALSMGQPHRAIPISVALCLAVAAKVHGTVVQECLHGKGETVKEGVLTIGHPSGTMEVGADTKGTAVECATLYRTARRLMEGRVLWDEPNK